MNKFHIFVLNEYKKPITGSGLSHSCQFPGMADHATP